MQLQINVNVGDKKSIMEAMAVLHKLSEGTVMSTPEPTLENGHIKPLRKKAAKQDETFDLEAETFDTTKDDPEMTEVEEAKKISQTEVIKAFQVFAGAKSRVEAAKVLAKFKVKSVKELKESDYEKVLKLLAV